MPHGHRLLLALTVLFTLAGLSTLVPQASASHSCLLGYRAHCPFTPISSLLCFAAAGAVCLMRARRKRRSRSQ